MTRRTASWIFITLAFVALVAASAATSSSGPGVFDGTETPDGWTVTVGQDDGAGSKDIAIVPVQGVIVNGEGNAGGGLVGSDDLVPLLESFIENKDVDGVVLEIDTPGGAVLASDEIALAVKELRESGTPVVSWMRSVAASGGYYISAPANTIVAHPETITGSIGVILSYPNLQGLADKVGIEEIVIKSGPLKDMGSPFRELTKQEREILQSSIDQSYERFVGVVASGRGLPDGEVRTIADGRIYSGQDAFDLQLVDRLGGRDEMIEAAKDVTDSKKLRVTQYDLELGFGDLFGFSAKFGAADPVAQYEALRRRTSPTLEYRAAL